MRGAAGASSGEARGGEETVDELGHEDGYSDLAFVEYVTHVGEVTQSRRPRKSSATSPLASTNLYHTWGL